MKPHKKTYIIILGFILLIPLSFDNALININNLHRLLFSILCFFLSVLVLFSSKSLKHIYISKIFFAVAILFPLCITVSSIVNGNEILLYEDLSLLLNLLSFSFLIIILSNLIDEETFLKFIFVVIIISGFLVSVVGLLQLYGLDFLNLTSNTRPGSTLSIRNFASEYLVGVVPFVLLSFIVKKSLKFEIFSFCISVIILSYLFLLRSRAAFVSLIICLIFFTIFLLMVKRKYSYKLNIKKFVSLTILSLVISFVAGSFQAPNVDKERKNLHTTITSVFDSDYAPNIARIKYYETSFEMFNESPLLGIGTGAWFGLYPKYNGEDYNDENIFFTANLNPHNDFLEILTENGIIGFFIFITLIALSFIKLIKHCNKNIYFIALTTSFISILIISLFSFPKDNTSVMLLLFLAIGIANSAYTKTNGKSQLKINFKLLTLVLSSIILVTVPFNFLRYKYEKDYLEALNDKASNNIADMNEKLVNIIDEVYPVDPNKMPLSYYKGVGFFQTKEYGKALKSFKIALNLAPYVPQVLSNTAATYYTLNKTENAETLLLNIKTMFPNYIEPQINLLAIYVNTGKDSLAMKLLADLDNKNLQDRKIKNFSVFQNIKKHYYEKSFD